MSESLYDTAFDEPSIDAPQVMEDEEELSDDEQALLYNGHLTGEVKLGNRVIRLRTLKIGEELEASLLAVPYKDTADAGRALVSAYVAAAITTVDGKRLTMPLGPSDNELEQKWQYVLDNWYWHPTITAVYDEYNNLLERVNKAAESVKKG